MRIGATPHLRGGAHEVFHLEMALHGQAYVPTCQELHGGALCVPGSQPLLSTQLELRIFCFYWAQVYL